MKVSVVRTAVCYPEPPFSPSEAYPEYPFPVEALSGAPNTVYAAVRKALYLTGLDAANFGSACWNPFGSLVPRDGAVVLKPNFVNHFNPLSSDRVHYEALVTQGAVIRAVADYLLIAGKGRLKLVFADLPIQSADFSRICEQTGLSQVAQFLAEQVGSDVRIELLDLRDYRIVTDASGAVIRTVRQPTDPMGYAIVDLGEHSALKPIEGDSHLFRAPDYDGDATVRMHSEGRHQYVIPRSILEAGLLVNLPKLKVHRKVGVTLCLKNLVGIVGDKSCLPHWRAGGPESGGDEYPSSTWVRRLRSRIDFRLRRLGAVLWQLLRPIGRLLLRLDARGTGAGKAAANGDWYGNDTCWRMVHDLNRIAVYADHDGILRDSPQRKYFAVVDGIVAGEGEGPLKPTPVPAGVIIAGEDPVAVDLVGARLMGLDWLRIPMLRGYRSGLRYPFSAFAGDPDAVEVVEGPEAGSMPLTGLLPLKSFEPPPGWKGHIELQDRPDSPEKGLQQGQPATRQGGAEHSDSGRRP